MGLASFKDVFFKINDALVCSVLVILSFEIKYLQKWFIDIDCTIMFASIAESVEKRHSLLSRKNSVEISAKSLSTSKTAPSPLQFVKDTFGSSRSRIMSPPADSSTKVDHWLQRNVL